MMLGTAHLRWHAPHAATIATVSLLFVVMMSVLPPIDTYRTDYAGHLRPSNQTYFKYYDPGFVGRYGDPANYQRERTNEGAFNNPSQELVFGDLNGRQVCPGMVGPFSDGSYYCTAKDYGYCDQRSGTCFCNTGYQGIDCSACQPTHYRMGNLCYPKLLCPNDCSNMGTCNYNNGTCTCNPFRTGEACQHLVCTTYNPFCRSCNAKECLGCLVGYYLTMKGTVCSSCTDFDPRCTACTLDRGCTNCTDPLLTSVRRSGYRSVDPVLPFEEFTRQLSMDVPFGAKTPEIFDESEPYVVVTDPTQLPLQAYSTTCSQGVQDDEYWTCSAFPASHMVCGSTGALQFTYPNYVVSEGAVSLRLSVRRTGGGYGNVSVDYFIKHFTTNDSDAVPTQHYTSSQSLHFYPGVVERTFLVRIIDDNDVEGDEVFQVYLGNPTGGAHLGPQSRTNVTIVDNDLHLLNAKFTRPVGGINTVTQTAGAVFNTTIQAAIAYQRLPMTTGGERFLAVVENYNSNGSATAGLDLPSRGPQRNAERTRCNVSDLGNGRYRVAGLLWDQGLYQQRVWHAFPGGLRGQYFDDAYFTNMAVERIDYVVNFTWATGRITPNGANYVSVRWTGAVLTPRGGYYSFKVEADAMARLWVDGDLLIDHLSQQRANMEPSRQIHLQGNTLYELELEYMETAGAGGTSYYGGGHAFVRLRWSISSAPSPRVRFGGLGGVGDLLPMQVIGMQYLYALYEIDLSPTVVTIVSAPTNAATTECHGPGITAAVSTVTTSFSCCPRDKYGNLRDDADAFFLSSERVHATFQVINNLGLGGNGAELLSLTPTYNFATHCFDFTYTPERGGIYQLNVTYQRWYDTPIQHLYASPFQFYVPAKLQTFGPSATIPDAILGTTPPGQLRLSAGSCYNFTIEARDTSGTRRTQGGDVYEVYGYRMLWNSPFPGHPLPSSLSGARRITIPTRAPTMYPTPAPSIIPSLYAPTNTDTYQAVIRHGVVTDNGNGNYSVEICPVIAGTYDLNVFFLGPKGRADSVLSLLVQQSVAKAPYTMVVTATSAIGYTTTAAGPGLTRTAVGYPTHFVVTVRDPYDNVLLHRQSNLTMTVNGLPASNVTVFDFDNGSYYVQYYPKQSGTNSVAVKVNGQPIRNSPFKVQAVDTTTDPTKAYGVGAGLHVGTAGVTSYFELFALGIDGLRVANENETFRFSVQSAIPNTAQVNGSYRSLHNANAVTGRYLQPCPLPPVTNHPACNPYDTQGGHYWGNFTPTIAGSVLISIYFRDPIFNTTVEDGFITPGEFLFKATKVWKLLSASPYQALINPNVPHAEAADVTGDIYDAVAGRDQGVQVDLRDAYRNHLRTGGALVELAMLCVARYGAVQPFASNIGTPSGFFYRGFYAGYPTVYGTVHDLQNGVYVATYNAPQTGQYVMRVAVAEPGLNASYFTSTSFGVLTDGNFNAPEYQQRLAGLPINLGTTLSWTGNLGAGSYQHYYGSAVQPTIDFDMRYGGTPPRPPAGKQLPQQYWSARWTGLITPQYAEVYTFILDADGQSDVTLYIGGVGTALNGSWPLGPGGVGAGQVVVVNTTAAGTASGSYGHYKFTDARAREFVLEMVHLTEDAHLTLRWQSPSTPLAVVPASAFSHYRNITFFNTTVHPTTLAPGQSTAYGPSLSSAVVGQMASIWVYARDAYGNLMERGGDVPTLLAVGPDGAAFRGVVTDFGNSSYLVQYLPTAAGVYRLYVTVGCCAPHPDVGLSLELAALQPLLVAGAPFLLTVRPSDAILANAVGTGEGLLGGLAGLLHTFNVHFRDVYENPTSYHGYATVAPTLRFVDQTTGYRVDPASVGYTATPSAMEVTYNMTRPGTYAMTVTLQDRHPKANQTRDDVHMGMVGSPFVVVVSPGMAYAGLTVCKGAALRSAVVAVPQTFSVQLFDAFNNPLQTGGARFYARLVGGYVPSVAQAPSSPALAPADVVAPACADQHNGRYTCAFTPTTTGTHGLHISLLAGPPGHPGGDGLLASYYDSSEPFAPGVAPVATRVDPAVSFAWDSGYILPSVAGTGAAAASASASAASAAATSGVAGGGVVSAYVERAGDANAVTALPTRGNGQSVRWTGYLVAPRADTYQLTVRALHANASVFLDNVLVFDTVTGTGVARTLVGDAAYRIVVEVKVGPEPYFAPVEVALMWAANAIRASHVPQFFLYSAADEVQFSPFTVVIT